MLRLIPLKGEAIVVDADEALVGREANCNVVVPHPSVSRRHALLKRKQGVFFVVDQGSANGTFVDSKRIVDAALREGTVLRFGSSTFKVEVRDETPVESVAVDELVISETMVGPQSFSATLLDADALADDPDPPYGAEMSPTEEPAPTVQTPVLKAPPVPDQRRRPSQVDSRPPSARVQSALVAPNRGPAFWLMIVAAALALLFVGAALGLGAAFLARRMGWL